MMTARPAIITISTEAMAALEQAVDAVSLSNRQRVFNCMQSLLPQQLLSRLMYLATRWRWQPWKNLQIRWFVRHYGVDMQEALHSDPDEYACFNDFFTRALRSDARPLASGSHTLTSPVDGRLSQAGRIRRTSILQAKGHDYSVAALLAGDNELAATFIDGDFITLYLAPRDYHRVHMPCSGHLLRMIHVPGKRFAVNETSVAGIDNLFARNERLINLFETEAGSMALIMVGALFVGSMQTVWSGPVPSSNSGEAADYDYSRAGIRLERGEELGRFNMGSTVILLFPAGRAKRESRLQPAAAIRMGEAIGTLV